MRGAANRGLRTACLVVALSTAGCATRQSPLESGLWESGVRPPQHPPAFSVRSVAGEYACHSPGGGTALVISKDGRWTCRDVPFIGGARCYGSGTIRVSGEDIVLEENDAIGFPTGEFVVFTLVRWCERRYLVAPGEFAAFCNHINWGFEPDRGMWGRAFLLDEGAERPNVIHEVTGPPELPPQWLKAILREPITGSILEVLPEGRLRVDLGSADGVFEQMDLRTADEQGRFLTFLHAVTVSEHESILAPRTPVHDGAPQPGWKVTCDARGAEYAPR